MLFASNLLCSSPRTRNIASVIVRSRKTLANASSFLHFIAMKFQPRLPSPLMLVTSIVLAFVGSACSSRDVREWQPSDHDQPVGQQQGQVPARPGSSSQTGPDKSLVELAWARNCASCHGPVGRGDGPQGAMMKASDLTNPEWQDKVTDEQISEVITKGRNRMPAFGTLPPQVITGLVTRIRTNRGR